MPSSSSRAPNIRRSSSVSSPSSAERAWTDEHHQPWTALKRTPSKLPRDSNKPPFLSSANGKKRNNGRQQAVHSSTTASSKLRAVSPCLEDTSPLLAQQDESYSLAGKEATILTTTTTIEHRDDGDRSTHYQDDPSPIPEHYVVYIQQAFGSGGTKKVANNDTCPPRPVDLYKDVFAVSSKADDRELRIAYFKRGREVLSSRVVNRKHDALAKKRFQAVSMAYEILTTPELRSFYDKYGLVSSLSDPPLQACRQALKISVETRNNHVPIKRSSSAKRRQHPRDLLQATDDSSPSRGRSSDRGQNSPRKCRSLSHRRSQSRSSIPHSRSIRWNEHVEELVYEKDPEELLGMRPPLSTAESALGLMLGDPPASTKPPKKLRKVKRKVILEAQELAKELEALQDDTSDNLVSYFLDDLEASLDGLEASVEGFVRYAMSGSEEDEKVHEKESPQSRSAKSTEAMTVKKCLDETSIGTDDFPTDNAIMHRPSLSSFPVTSSTKMIPVDEVSEATEQLEVVVQEDVKPVDDPNGIKILKAFESPYPTGDDSSHSSNSTSGRRRAATDPALAGHPSVRDRIAVLAAAVHEATTDTKHSSKATRLSRLRRYSTKSKSQASNLDDPAQSLFDDLTKPVPTTNIRKSSQKGSHPSSAETPLLAKDSSRTLDDVAKELFRDLTKPPPSGYEKDSERKIASLIQKKSKGKQVPAPPYSKNLLTGYTTEPFDPFNLDSSDSSSRRPPDWIYDSHSKGQDDDDEMTTNTVSTMSASEATVVLRDKLFAKRLTHRATEERRRRLSIAKPKHQPEQQTTPPTARAVLAKSPVAVQQFDDTFDVVSGFESHDANVVKLERTRGSALSSLTGHASTFTAQQEHAWRSLCHSASKTAPKCLTPDIDDGGGAPSTADPSMLGAPCAHPSSSTSDDDQNLMSQIMVYMKAFTDEVDKVGMSISNLMTAAVAVPEDDVQGVLNVLSQEMDSTVGSTNIP